MLTKALLFAALALVVSQGEAKVFGQCEFANTIKKFGLFPSNQISTWVCIANYESHFNTNAYNPSSGDHGIYQINERWWCSKTSTPGGSCKKRCSDFQNDDIYDDSVCVKTIWNEHQRLSGDGFNAWTTYVHCKGDTSKWIAGC